ncbi:MAG: aspartate--tRNA ligase [Chlorobi bacterium]|nr:aspartate--tRNA ligase [Chlorobiota bacterium]MCI0715963.1 aspartate--tRNA ligase [Chlorobiota bacterium]
MQFTQRTNTCGELSLSDVGKTVALNGWVADKRDLGGVIFINLRDRYGVTQITVNSENKGVYDSAKSLGLEYVISASGKVQRRTSSNPKMKTGEIEVLADKIEILNTSEVTPFVVEEEVKASEELRFKYRYLDLRRRKIASNLEMRSRVYGIVHRYFERHGFVEVETPILMKSTPEGARDYLVPSRIHKGEFYALPQSPQTYKQILMVAGLDRYVQICKCFRDEDLRADRQPEFTQIDLEMSFVTEADVFRMCEGVIYDIWKEAKGVGLKLPLPVMSYDEAMETYGTDKPDLRIKGWLKIVNITGSVKGSEFKVFTDAINSGGIAAGIKLSSVDVTRKIIDSLTEYVKQLGFGGLGYIKYNADDTASSPMLKFLSEEIQNKIKNDFNSQAGDTLFILSGEKAKVLSSLGSLRLKLAEMFNLFDESKDEFLWVNDFPLFSYNEEEKCFVANHHAFTMPKEQYLKNLESKNKDDILSIRADCYDMVCNGSEFGSGSIRIHRPDIQKKVFNVIGLTDEEAKQKFGFLLEAFTYGAPPHGGFAFGFDRIIATLCGTRDIRETIAFPKTTSAVSPMDGSPSPVDEKQLKELGLKIT